MKPICWGILGCGRIASQMAESLKLISGAQLTACASRTHREKAFAEKYAVPLAYSDYETLVANPEVDVVYIANTHNFHYESMLLALEHGKHVLCEKAFTINAKQAESVIVLARRKNLFLMEAMWTRCLPAIIKLREWLAEEKIGPIKKLNADLCVLLNMEPECRLMNPELAGGALLDIGIYPISFASMIFGKPPIKIRSNAYLGETGVDEHSEYLFQYEGDQCAQLSASFSFVGRRDVCISGTKGWIQIPNRFHGAQKLLRGEGPNLLEEVFLPFEGKGLHFEATEVMRCIREGLTESPHMPLDETLGIMRTLDTLRAQWGLRYPDELPS